MPACSANCLASPVPSSRLIHAGHADVAAELAEVLDRAAHVVGDVQRLQVVAGDDDDLLAHVARDRQAEAAADYVAEEVEQHVVEAPVVEAELLERLEAVDDAAPAAAAADLGAAELHRIHAVALEADVADGHALAGQFLLRTGFDDGRAGLAAEQQAGGVALRVAADQQHLLALLGHHVAQVGQREALADAALAVDRDDLRRLRRRRGRHRIGFDRGLGLEALVAHEDDRIAGGVHWQCLQSRTIFRQPGSPNAVR